LQILKINKREGGGSKQGPRG